MRKKNNFNSFLKNNKVLVIVLIIIILIYLISRFRSFFTTKETKKRTKSIESPIDADYEVLPDNKKQANLLAQAIGKHLSLYTSEEKKYNIENSIPMKSPLQTEPDFQYRILDILRNHSEIFRDIQTEFFILYEMPFLTRLNLPYKSLILETYKKELFDIDFLYQVDPWKNTIFGGPSYPSQNPKKVHLFLEFYYNHITKSPNPINPVI